MPKSNCRIASPSSLALALFKMTATYGPQQPVMPTPFIRSRVPSGNYVVAIRKAPRLFLSLSFTSFLYFHWALKLRLFGRAYWVKHYS